MTDNSKSFRDSNLPKSENNTFSSDLFLAFILLVFSIVVTQIWFTLLLEIIREIFGEDPSILLWVTLAFIITGLFLLTVGYVFKTRISAISRNNFIL